MSMECRFYANQYPEIDDVVLVQVKSLSDIGAYVTLLEYGRVEGMIQISEMCNRRIRSISKLTRVGNIEVCMVLRVDADRGYIDLSKRRVSNEDGLKAKELFARNKTIHGIMRHTATILERPLEDICKLISWPLFKEFGMNRTYDALRRIVNDGSIDLISPVCSELVSHPEVVEALMTAASRKLTPSEVRVRALFDVTCYSTDGVLAIKESIKQVVDACKDDQIVIKLISAPQFLIETSGIGKEACSARIVKALDMIKANISARGGNYKLRSPPDVIGDDEEALPKFEDEDVSSDEEEEGEIERSDNEDDSESSSSSSSEDEEVAAPARKGKGNRK